MRSLPLALLSGAIMLAGLIQPVGAQQPTTASIYVVTYFEVAASGGLDAAATLRQFAETTQREDGNAELIALHEIARPGRFAIVEAWRDKAALDGHAAAMTALGAKLRPLFSAPFDPRQFVPMSVAAPATAAAKLDGGAVWVLTHVDVFPAGKDETASMVQQLAADSRGDSGALRFDAVVSDAHPNHFHLIEAWRDRQAFETHTEADHTRAFRARLVPFEGALYDQRLYETVPKAE